MILWHAYINIYKHAFGNYWHYMKFQADFFFSLSHHDAQMTHSKKNFPFTDYQPEIMSVLLNVCLNTSMVVVTCDIWMCTFISCIHKTELYKVTVVVQLLELLAQAYTQQVKDKDTTHSASELKIVTWTVIRCSIHDAWKMKVCSTPWLIHSWCVHYFVCR